MSTAQRPVGYIGLGNIGAPMAKRLLAWPAGLVVFDTRPEATEPFAQAGAVVAANPREVAEATGLVCVTVVNDEQVRQVLTGPDGILAGASAGTVVAVHSTISDTTAVELAAVCAESGVDLVDAPVSGGAPGAATGALAVMVGGSERAFTAVREPFRLLGELVVHAGDVGAGTRMKLARNLLHFVAFTAVTEAARLAEASGLNLVDLGKVVRHSDALTGGPGAIMHRDTAAPVAESDGWHAILSHVRNLGEKDLSLALDLGERTKVDLPLARLALARLGPGLGVGQGSTAKQATGEEDQQ